MMAGRRPLTLCAAVLAGVAVLAGGCGSPGRPAATDAPAAPPGGGFQSGDCNNVTDADVAEAVGSSTFTKVVDSDAGCFWQENTMLGSFGAGMGISTWWYRGSDMDTERTLEQQAGRTLTELSVDATKVSRPRCQRLQHLRFQGLGRHHLADPGDEPGHAAPDLVGLPSGWLQLSQERVN